MQNIIVVTLGDDMSFASVQELAHAIEMWRGVKRVELKDVGRTRPGEKMLKQFLMFWCEDEVTAQRYIDNDWWVEMPVSALDEVLRKFVHAQYHAGVGTAQSVDPTVFDVPPKCPQCGQRHTWKHQPA